MNGRGSKRLFLACALLTWLPTAQLQAAPAQIPMFLGGAIEPNVMFTLDDSGSMHYELMPDTLIWSNFVYPRPDKIYHDSSDLPNWVVSFDDTNNIYARWARSSAMNRVYYNPAVTYKPWSNSDGTLMPPASPTCAYHNPAKTSLSCRNLTVDNTQSAVAWDSYNGSLAQLSSGVGATWVTGSLTFWPAVYYNYVGETAADIEDASKYVRVEIRSTTSSYAGSADRSDCAAAPKCTYAEEIQNFANWYTYYRSRILLARAGIGRAFAEQGAGMRVGFAAINQGSKTVDLKDSPGAVISGVRKFIGTDRQAFFKSLYEHPIPWAITPLRRALDDVGQYFLRDDDDGPWSESPGSSSTAEHLSCRQSYNILMTDGYWNSSAAPTSSGEVNATNADNKSGPSITGLNNLSYEYTPVNPYQSADVNTLADVAMYYWNRDLRTDIANNVPTNSVDEAFWQHLVTFGVGLGVSGNLDPSTDLPLLTSGDKSWPTPKPYDPADPGFDGLANIDDLWHAALNSRGGFFSAADPAEFSNKLSDSLQQIIGRTGSSASIATNSTRLNAGTFIYQARFDSDTWLGKLLGFKVDENTGDIIDDDVTTAGLDPYWEAGSLLDSRVVGTRDIFTHEAADSNSDDHPGVDFVWSSLPATFQGFLNTGPSGADALGEKRLQFLHGDRTQEVASGGGFRNRQSILADIVNSDPTFVGQQDYGYNLLPNPEGNSYITYRNSDAYKNRVGVVYVGANDGMLHAFKGETGEELFAYIPEYVVPDLWRLTDPAYNHRFFVDGSSVGKDAYINGGWKTLLVATTGAGGKSVFALDVSTPTSFDKEDVLWEVTPSKSDYSELGYTIGQPSLVRLANGKWGAVFGNGYNSASNRAQLFIVDVEDGELIKKIDTGVGDATKPNGLAGPLVVDTNGDRIGDRVYAGDLHGNMWAFDISNTSKDKWVVAYKSGSTFVPLFKAKDEDGVAQPITAKPDSGKHPAGGLMVYFGTGKYFEDGDGAVKRKNTFYGIRDDFTSNNPAPVSGRSVLLQQVITHETYDDPSGDSQLSDGTTDIPNPFPWDLRVTTEKPIDWQVHKGWYLDLRSPLSFRDWEGERSVSAPLLLEQRIVFTTVIPSQDPCAFGGTSWLMELSSVDGARLSVTPFDLNGDGVFNQEDYVEIWSVDANNVPVKIKIPVSGKRSKVGIIKTPAIVKTKEKEFKYTSGSSGDIEKTLESRSYREGRQSWSQLR